MAWLGKISTNLDFAGAVNKLQESVKNIERNFDSALGFEAKSESSEAPQPVAPKRGPLTEPPAAPVIQAKDVTENGTSQAEPSLLKDVFGFARAKFESFEKAQAPLIEAAATGQSSSEKSQKKLEEEIKSKAALTEAPAAQSSPEKLQKKLEEGIKPQTPVLEPPGGESASEKLQEELQDGIKAQSASAEPPRGKPVAEKLQEKLEEGVKPQIPLTEPLGGEAAAAKTQQQLEEDSDKGVSHPPGGLDALTQNETEIGKGTSQEKCHEPEEVTKSVPEIDSTEVSLKSDVFQQPSDSALVGNLQDGVKQEDIISAEKSTREQVSSPDEQGGEVKQDEVDTSAQEAVPMQEPQPAVLLEREVDLKEDPVDIPKHDVIEEPPGLPGVSGNEEKIEGSDASTSQNFQVPSSNTSVSKNYVIVDEDGDDAADERNVTVTDSVAEPTSINSQTKDLTTSEASELPKGISPVEDLPTEPLMMLPKEPASENREVSKLKEDLKMMEAALHGAAKQSQMKADEISRLMIENEDLKSSLEDLKSKTGSLELDALREEYQQRVGVAERKVYALTKERDMLRREQSRKSDSSVLLKEKDEIIKQVMAEGEELSKKQAVQEGTMRKLRAQIRELEEEKNKLNSKLQVEEGKVESIRKDKEKTEAALQEAVEKGQVELTSLREYHTNALAEAQKSQAQAEARAESEAKVDLERRLRESADRETALLKSLEDLRQALSRTEQQAAYREDMHRSDMEDMEKRCQAAEARYEELVTHMPDSTRPLRKQIEALQESTAMRAEAWTGVERSLNFRIHETEIKAAGAQERERQVTERLSQTLSRVAVMEAQLSMLRAENSQLTRSLEKERQRASESRQEYLAATELSTTLDGRAKQLEEEFEAMRLRSKQELKEERARRHALEQELDQEKALIADYEKRLRSEGRSALEKGVLAAQNPLQSEFSSSHKAHKRLPSVSSAGSVEENHLFTQNSMDSDGTPNPRLSFSDRPPSPFVRGPGTSLEQLETLLRQREGELSSCFQRLASLESTRDSLAEELVRATTQCEFLRGEVSFLPGLRAELDSLRRRHTSALELMGERDEEVEELKADLADVKQMYREQITMLVGQIERLSATITSSR